ncbi:MAG: hypothetical protein JOY99_08730 [Sphingomonadaceae bacterium]|nr:hypothetical protein [Sphingomonadaceae bacterium]
MSRLGPLLGFDAGAALIAIAGATLGLRAHRAILRAGDDAPGATGLRIAGTMIAALGIAGIVFATTYHFSLS